MNDHPIFYWLRLVFESGRDTLKVVLILNGGASIALLAFVENILENDVSKDLLFYSRTALLVFSLGVFVAGLAAFLSNLAYWGVALSDKKDEKNENEDAQQHDEEPSWLFRNYAYFFLTVMGLMLMSLVLFLLGTLLSVMAIAYY